LGIGLVVTLVVVTGLGSSNSSQAHNAEFFFLAPTPRVGEKSEVVVANPDVVPAATATRAAEEAELADLRTRVAELETEVARLTGAGDAIAGRLGGARGTFAEKFGEPLVFIGADQAVYAMGEAGQVTATFRDGMANRLVIMPPRPADLPTDQPDAADWTLDEARQVALRLAPADMTFDEEAAGDTVGLVLTGTSDALAKARGGSGAPSGCSPATDARRLTIIFIQPTAETVSVITIEAAGEPGAIAATVITPPEEGRTGRRSGATVNTSLGGTAKVNNVVVQAFDVRTDATGTSQPAAGHRFIAVQFSLANQTDRPLTVDLGNFVLVDGDGQEITAICGGAEPAITTGELAPGQTLDGWITFQAPTDFRPIRVVFLMEGAKVGFTLD
jgi:hypothetical protein